MTLVRRIVLASPSEAGTLRLAGRDLALTSAALIPLPIGLAWGLSVYMTMVVPRLYRATPTTSGVKDALGAHLAAEDARRAVYARRNVLMVGELVCNRTRLAMWLLVSALLVQRIAGAPSAMCNDPLLLTLAGLCIVGFSCFVAFIHLLTVRREAELDETHLCLPGYATPWLYGVCTPMAVAMGATALVIAASTTLLLSVAGVLLAGVIVSQIRAWRFRPFSHPRRWPSGLFGYATAAVLIGAGARVVLNLVHAFLGRFLQWFAAGFWASLLALSAASSHASTARRSRLLGTDLPSGVGPAPPQLWYFLLTVVALLTLLALLYAESKRAEGLGAILRALGRRLLGVPRACWNVFRQLLQALLHRVNRAMEQAQPRSRSNLLSRAHTQPIERKARRSWSDDPVQFARQVYGRMLQLTAKAGVPRHEAQTAYEFAERLDHAWPPERIDILPRLKS